MVIENIFEHARKTPAKIAIHYGDRPVSYGEFAFWISYARRFLSQHDLRIGSIAVLCGVSTLDTWVFGFSLRRLGLTTIHVASLETLEEIGLRDIGCVVTSIRNDAGQIPPTIKIDRLIKIADQTCLSLTAEGVPDLPATTAPAGGHILLTSGTTGLMKKVHIDAAGLAMRTSRYASVYSISERSVTNIFYFAMWTGAGYKMPSCTWSMGGCVVIHRGLLDLHRSLFIDGITHAFVNPKMLSDLLKAPACELRRSETMQLFVTGGALSYSLAQSAKTLVSPNVFTCVASTEVGTCALTRVERPEDVGAHFIEPSIKVQVVDQDDRQLPAGVEGVVRIGATDGVTSYFDDEEASRKFFRHGYFYPGDLGMFQPDGRLVLRGRVTNVINILGEKKTVEPIEQALQERLGVGGVCILMLNEGLDEKLCIVIETPRPIGEAELTASISAEMPRRPDTVVHFIEALPRNDMGKIDRSALRKLIAAARKESLA